VHDDQRHTVAAHGDADFVTVFERDEVTRQARHDHSTVLGLDRRRRRSDDRSGYVTCHSHKSDKRAARQRESRTVEPSPRVVAVTSHLFQQRLDRVEFQLGAEPFDEANSGHLAVEVAVPIEQMALDVDEARSILS